MHYRKLLVGLLVYSLEVGHLPVGKELAPSPGFNRANLDSTGAVLAKSSFPDAKFNLVLDAGLALSVVWSITHDHQLHSFNASSFARHFSFGPPPPPPPGRPPYRRPPPPPPPPPRW